MIGTPVANRNRAEVEDLIGFFVNTLAVRLDYSGRPTVSEVLDRVKRQALQAQEHQDLPFEHVVELVNPPRSLSHTPVFQVMFAWQNTEQSALDLGGLPVTPLGVDYSVAKFDLTLELMESAGCIRGSLQYATSLFERETMQRYVTYLARLLSEMVVGEDEDITQIAVMPPAERHQVLVEWNATDRAYPSDRCVHELFEEQVARTPDAVAVVHEAVQVSYGELNARANRLAHYLRSLGVGPESRVALCLERSVEMVVSILAVLKAGGAYVPLDPTYPPARLVSMLEDSAPSVVLTHGAVEPNVRAILARDAAVIEVDQSERWSAGSSANPARGDLTPANLAYIIYTSGSTGHPKGVMVLHGNVARLFETTQPRFGFGADDVWTLFHSIAFDFSVWEMWGALFYGGQLVIVPKMVSRSPREFYELLCASGVTILNQTPSAFRALIDAQRQSKSLHRLRHVFFGGEALDVHMLKPWYERAENGSACLTNMYGITETTVHVTCHELAPQNCEKGGGGSPIGSRIPDLRIYILDEAREPVPIGVAGELYIGGAGVARGYWNRADLTAERFVDSPFVAGDRLYKTGDVGRYLSDGTIEYLGRNDAQVKIRGFRIELGEIEARLVENEPVSEAVVVAREDDGGEKRLVAYYVAAADARVIDAEELRFHLTRTLPEYMVPAAYVPLESMPLTVNGKVDRSALPVPDDMAYSRSVYEAPQGEVEQTLARIWSELLKVERVGRHDNFFMLGGHSLLVVRLIDRMRLAGLHADVRTLFTASTLMELADAVRREALSIVVPPNGIVAGSDTITPDMLPLVSLNAEQVEIIVARVPGGARNIQDIYPLAPLQEGLLFHHLLTTDRRPVCLVFGVSLR